MPRNIPNYTISKTIKITPNQNANWNPKKVRELLDEKINNSTSISDSIILLKQLFNLMDNKMTFTKTPIEEDKILIKKVMELI